jgi:hypothetical protein
VKNTFFLINAIKKVYDKHMLLKQQYFSHTKERIHVTLICELYEILYKPIYKKNLSFFFKEILEKKKIKNYYIKIDETHTSAPNCLITFLCINLGK